MKRLGYLTGPAAVDVAAVLDIPTETSRGRHGQPERFLDLDRMDPWTRFRVGWVLVAVSVVLQSTDALHRDRGRDPVPGAASVRPTVAPRPRLIDFTAFDELLDSVRARFAAL